MLNKINSLFLIRNHGDQKAEGLLFKNEGEMKTFPDKQRQSLLLADLPYKKCYRSPPGWNERTLDNNLKPYEEMKTVVKVITQANIKWYYCSFGTSEFSHPLAINQNHFHIFRYFVTATLHLQYPKSVLVS